MKKMINFLTLLILITILSIITIFITSCNSSSNNNIIGSSGGSGGSGGSGNEIILSVNAGIAGSPVSQINGVNAGAISEFANGLLDPNTNSIFILGNDFPGGPGANPNVYLFKFNPSDNTFNGPLTIDFTSGTNGQFGNLYIDQDTNNIYAMGSHNNGTDSDIFVAKIDKNNLSFVNGFGSGSPIPGLVLLDRGNVENTGGLLVDSTNNVLYVAGYNNQGKVIIFKLSTNDGNLVGDFGSGGYTEIDIDNNTSTQEYATDILTYGTDLIIVGEQQINPTTFKLMLFKVNPNTGNVVPGSLITIDPPGSDTFVASPLNAAILNDKVYLGANLLDSTMSLKKSVLAVFDLNNPTNTRFLTFKDNSNNDIKIFINDIYYPGTGNIIYLSGQDATTNNAAFIKFDTSNNSGSYLIADPSTAGSWWGNVFYNNYLYIFGRLNSSSSSFTVLPIQNP
jgi:hypothetical protein